MLKRFKISEGKLVENGQEACPIFVYIAPTEEERKYLIEDLKVDEHNINSSLDPNELGRVEFEENHAFIIIKRPKRYSSDDKFLLKISSVGLFLFPDRLIILLNEEAQLFDGRPFSRLAMVQDLFLRILQRCILHFEEHLRVVQMISDELEVEINKSMSNQHLLSMFNISKSLVYYLTAIGSNGKVIEKIRAHQQKLSFSQDAIEFLEDVLIENAQCYEQANIYSQVVSSMMDARVSVVNNNLNIFIKTLSLLMICIMLPTLVLNIFSMNVKLPFSAENSLLPFWIIVGLSVGSTVAVIALWRYKKW